MYKRNYGGAIWTNHALQRLADRGLTQEWAWQTFQYPEISKEGKQVGTMEYQRKFGEYTVTVVANQNERNEWVILSCWVNPPFAGSIDIRNKTFAQKYHHASFFKKLWLLFLKEVLNFY